MYCVTILFLSYHLVPKFQKTLAIDKNHKLQLNLKK